MKDIIEVCLASCGYSSLAAILPDVYPMKVRPNCAAPSLKTIKFSFAYYPQFWQRKKPCCLQLAQSLSLRMRAKIASHVVS